MLGEARIGLTLVIIFIATLAIFYIFDSINSLSTKCQTNTLDLCEELAGVSGTMTVILLLIGSFVMISASAVYLWISST